MIPAAVRNRPFSSVGGLPARLKPATRRCFLLTVMQDGTKLSRIATRAHSAHNSQCRRFATQVRTPMSSTRKPPSDLPPVEIDDTMTDPTSHGPGTVSRRFPRRHRGHGDRVGGRPGRCRFLNKRWDPNPKTLPKDQPEIYRGTASGAVLAQLKAAGVRTLFHTNTSGFGPSGKPSTLPATCKSST